MSRPKFTIAVWVLSVFGLPLAVYLGATIANSLGLPINTGCHAYDPQAAMFYSLLYGIPFATIVTVLSAFDILKRPITFRAWAILVSISFCLLALFIIYQAAWCQ